MIEPTVGRIVYFVPGEVDVMIPRHGNEPLAAMIVRVLDGNKIVNLAVFDVNGVPWGRCGVRLVQPGDERPSAGHYCLWMPFQVASAKRVSEAGTLAGNGATEAAG